MPADAGDTAMVASAATKPKRYAFIAHFLIKTPPFDTVSW